MYKLTLTQRELLNGAREAIRTAHESGETKYFQCLINDSETNYTQNQLTFKLNIDTNLSESYFEFTMSEADQMPLYKKVFKRTGYSNAGNERSTLDRLRRAYKEIEEVLAMLNIDQTPETPEEPTPETTTETTPETMPETMPEPTPTAPTAPTPEAAPITAPNFNLGLDGLINNVVKNAIEANAAAVGTQVQAYLDAHGIRPTKNVLEIHNLPEDTVTNAGVVHKKFETLLKAVNAGVNCMLVGSPATAKTTHAVKVAEALKREVLVISCSNGTDITDFFGYMDANGKPTITPFQKAYENGAIIVIDEIDALNPNTSAGANNAIDAAVTLFASGMVTKNKNTVFVCTANTHGRGANMNFVGRNPMDAATLDRFVLISWDIDENLEASFTNNKEWLKIVQTYRAAAEKKKIQVFITPRATLQGTKLLAAGLSLREVKEMCIFKGMSKAERDLLRDVEA